MKLLSYAKSMHILITVHDRENYLVSEHLIGSCGVYCEAHLCHVNFMLSSDQAPCFGT